MVSVVSRSTPHHPMRESSAPLGPAKNPSEPRRAETHRQSTWSNTDDFLCDGAIRWRASEAVGDTNNTWSESLN